MRSPSQSQSVLPRGTSLYWVPGGLKYGAKPVQPHPSWCTVRATARNAMSRPRMLITANGWRRIRCHQVPNFEAILVPPFSCEFKNFLPLVFILFLTYTSQESLEMSQKHYKYQLAPSSGAGSCRGACSPPQANQETNLWPGKLRSASQASTPLRLAKAPKVGTSRNHRKCGRSTGW